MEYTFVILIVCIALVYSHMLGVIKYAKGGVQYLTSLVDDTPEKLGNNFIVIATLVNRDLSPMQKLVSMEIHYTVELALAFIVNIVALYYPSEQMFNTFFGIIIIVFVVLLNVNSAWLFLRQRFNKKVISAMCNAYYNYKPPAETVAETEKLIEIAFKEIMEETIEEEMQKILDEDDNKNDDEQH